jgi:hypothetical protein
MAKVQERSESAKRTGWKNISMTLYGRDVPFPASFALSLPSRFRVKSFRFELAMV